MRYTVNITWDGLTASIGSSNQSAIGDHTYQCFLDNLSMALIEPYYNHKR